MVFIQTATPFDGHKHALFHEVTTKKSVSTATRMTNIIYYCFGKLRGGGCNPRNPPTGSASEFIHTGNHHHHRLAPLSGASASGGALFWTNNRLISDNQLLLPLSVQGSFFSRIDALLEGLEWEVESTTVTVTHSSAYWWDLLLPLA